MKERLRRWLPMAVLLIPALAVHAQTTGPLLPETKLAGVAGAPSATQETFTIATAQDLVATLTDLQTPAALTGAGIVVTQGAKIAGMATMAPPATSATVSLPGATGQYTLYVIGTPSSTFNVGTFSVCVAPKASPSACIQAASLSGNITVQSAPADPTVSTVSTTLTVTTGGAYTFTYADARFPVALAVAPNLALFQGSTMIAAPIPASPATITLNPGTYTLFAIAQADPTAKAGLYGITISGPPGVAPLLSSAFPVGTLGPASQPNNPSTQSVTLKVTDFAFPSALAGASAVVTSGATILGAASAAGGASSFTAPQGILQVWSFGTAGTDAGTYEVDLMSAAGSLLQTASGVNNGSSQAFAFVTPTPLAAGAYQATASDFEFPATLQGLQFAVAQNGAILKQLAVAGATGSVSFTAAAGSAVLLVDATTPTNGNGVFDVNVQTSATAPQMVFDQTQAVSPSSGVFTTQTINFGTSGNFDVTLTDLKFPAQFQSLALVVSAHGALVGKIFGGGTFTIPATPGAYQLNFVAMPGSTMAGVQQQYGLYGVQIVDSAPIVTLKASPATVTVGGATTLSWTTTNATSCTAGGGTFTGSPTTGSGTTSVSVAATTTYTLTCTGPGGSSAQSVVVTATTPPAKSGGGGGLDPGLLLFLGIVALLRLGKSLVRP
jgi:hypothetical protein